MTRAGYKYAIAVVRVLFAFYIVLITGVVLGTGAGVIWVSKRGNGTSAA